MSTKKSYINPDDIREMLYHDENYIREFAEAAVESFREFSTHYEKYLLVRDETNFRKAGHKIKPVAQMLHIHEIVDEYERAKTLLHKNESNDKLQGSADKISEIVETVIEELKQLT